MDTEDDFIVVGNTEGIRYAQPDRAKIAEAMIGGANTGVLLEGKSYVSKATGSLGPSLRGKVPIRSQEDEIIGVVSVGFSMDDIHGAVEAYGKRVFWITIIGLLIGVIGSIYLAAS